MPALAPSRLSPEPQPAEKVARSGGDGAAAEVAHERIPSVVPTSGASMALGVLRHPTHAFGNLAATRSAGSARPWPLLQTVPVLVPRLRWCWTGNCP